MTESQLEILKKTSPYDLSRKPQLIIKEVRRHPFSNAKTEPYSTAVTGYRTQYRLIVKR